MKLGNLHVRSGFHDAVDANRSQFVAFHTKPVQHVPGHKVVMRRLELRCTTSHDLMVDPVIPYVQSPPVRGWRPGGYGRSEGRSQVQLFVNRYVVRMAVGFIVIDEPPHIELLDELSLLIEEINGSFEPTEQLHTLRMVADECMH
jgi:hypothetical protein